MKGDRTADNEVRTALRRLARATEVPAAPPEREAELLRAFDGLASPVRRGPQRRAGAWWLSALAAATALLVTTVMPAVSGRRAPPPGRVDAHEAAASRGVRASLPVGDFMPWPGAASLPPLESGELVRMDLPVSVLPSLGVAPPAGHVTAVTADVVIGQDGLARAVRFVAD